MNIEMANRLYNYRKQSGLSQEELADKLGLSRQAVSKWERAEACPDTDNLIRLSKLYGVSIDTLLHVDPDEIITDSEDPDDKKASGTERNENESEKKENEKETEEPETNASGATVDFKAGIHIIDGDDVVNIDKSGIHVTDGEDVVHIGWKGIKIKKADDGGAHVSFDDVCSEKDSDGGDCGPDSGNCGVCGEKDSVDDKDVHVHFNIKDRKKKYIKDIPVGLLVLITYLVLGFILNLWHPAWILFICIPLIDSIINVINYKSIRKFNYPVFIVALYLFIGCVYGYWHPAWVSFLTIPLFYWIF